MTSPSSLDLHIQELIDQVDHLVGRKGPAAKRLDEIVALLHDHVPHYTWVGIYLLKGVDLGLGPFRGKPSPHTLIPVGEGICGAAAAQKQTIIVGDVNADPRYLACSIETKSEIVVPVMDGADCIGEIDIDSDLPNAFTEHDQQLLESIAKRIAPLLKKS